LVFHQVSLFAERGLSSATAAGVFGVIAPAAIAGQFFSGFMASKFSLRYMVAVAQLSLTASVLVMFAISAPWHAFLYGAMLGLTAGFTMNAMMAIWPQYYGRANLGSIRGVTQFSMMASSAAGPLALAIAFDSTGSYTAGLAIFVVLPLACAVAALAAIRPQPPLRGATSR
jgi:MFS family permease